MIVFSSNTWTWFTRPAAIGPAVPALRLPPGPASPSSRRREVHHDLAIPGSSFFFGDRTRALVDPQLEES